MLALCSFTLGIFSVGVASQLPELKVLLGLFFVLLLLVSVSRYKLVVCFLAGILYGACWGNYSLLHQLPDDISPADIIVTGEVVGLPSVDNGSRVRFNFRVLSGAEPYGLRTLRLSWYHPEVELIPGQIWQFRLRLRAPRGAVNPGGFDYQAWLMRQGISATGYVRDSVENTLLDRRHSTSSIRYQLQQAIQSSPVSSNAKALIVALTVGDRSLIPDQLWDSLSLAGVVHLLVISGLHIGLVATLSYYLGSWFSRLIILMGFNVTARYWGCLSSLIAALGYSTLAGFSLPTQRALIMVMVVILAQLLNRYVSRGLGFSMALAGVSMIDPLAFMSAGFWLSFSAVACLLWLVPVTTGASRWWQYLKTQWLIFLVLLLPLLWAYLPLAWFAPLTNVIAIPWVSFLIVPCCLLAALVFPVSASFSNELWHVAGWQLDYFVAFINAVPSIDFLPNYSTWVLNGASFCSLLLISVLVLLPKGLPGKYLSAVLLTGLLSVSADKPYRLRVSVLDVGQGLSIVVQTQSHALVYDAGSRFSSGFDTGESVVSPFLRRNGIARLDMLIVSHSDNDHAGGAAALARRFHPLQTMLGESVNLGPNAKTERCQGGTSWWWDGVQFSFLHPGQRLENSKNNRSCVLQIQYAGQSILLPGDIESGVEQRLLDNAELLTPVKLLVAPHHGSKTSSSIDFLQKLKPSEVVFSAGYRHHFGHPALTVVDRYQEQGSRMWNTANAGAVEFSWDDFGSMTVVSTRADNRRYWY